MKILQKNRGVTLVELMVVVALIGVLALAAGPSVFRTMERTRAKGVARGVADIFRLARSQSMSRGEALWVRVSPGTGPSDRGSAEIFRVDPTLADPLEPSLKIAAPRSCREFIAGNLEANPVHSYSLDGQSGKTYIRGQSPGAVDGLTYICFSPDGRILGESGRPLSAYSTNGFNLCDGEDYIVGVGEAGAVDTDADCAPDEPTRKSQRDERSINHFYKISVPYNGAIKLEQ